MIPDKQLQQIKEELDNCKKPIFLFHDDPDGLASFLLLYRYKREGRGVPIKAAPRLNLFFAQKVNEFGADKVFVLDIAEIEDSFYDNVKVPIVWIDHHDVKDVGKRIKYFNPRVQDPDEYSPVAYWCYRVVDQDMWIAAVGCVGDNFLPPFIDQLIEKYPYLLKKPFGNLEKIKYGTPLGKLNDIFSLLLKGPTSKVMNCIKILTRVDQPTELLKGESSRASYILKHYKKIREAYDEILKEADNVKPAGKLYVFIYKSGKISVTKDLANELAYKYPKKLVIVGREKSGEIKMSLRYDQKSLPPILEKILVGLKGYGGGHPTTCGACIAVDDFPEFLKRLENEI
ncbi:DHH family phosphoesterase [Candidatus Woesearchaeota archaeon]|nr:DHH family phosphoesterase [Candidatus Woesearchaeota archaeon]